MNNDKQIIEALLRGLDDAFARKAWHGPNLKGAIRGLTAREAAWRPSPRRHNIWEIVVHAAYWKYVVRRKILGGKRGGFPLKGSNWFTRPFSSDDKAWREDVALLVSEHEKLRAAVRNLAETGLSNQPSRSSSILVRLVQGIAFHDVYHAGQIQLLKRLQD